MYMDNLRRDAAIRFVDDYSSDSLHNLLCRTCIPTPSQSVNDLLGGGVRTQRVTEFVGSNQHHTADVLISIIIHYLYNNLGSNVVVITYNGIQNDHSLSQRIEAYLHRFLQHEDNELQAVVDLILNSIQIYHCYNIKQLKLILDDLLDGFTLGRSLEGGSSISAGPTPLQFVEPVTTSPSLDPDDIPRSTPRIVMLHMLTAIIEDSNIKDAWRMFFGIQDHSFTELMPEICTLLRSISRKLNTAVLVSNRYGMSLIESSLSEFTGERQRLSTMEWFVSSNRWNSTIDKKIHVSEDGYDREEKQFHLKLRLIKHKGALSSQHRMSYQPVPSNVVHNQPGRVHGPTTSRYPQCQVLLTLHGLQDENQD
ncbi:DNA repair RAD51 homolog 4, putative [Babesia ovis]|uniref:DNA repair RAD51 homolog 4, putative n=1 Tax=Babesia ovis TaxID=5869 RepID=A0A9W5TEG7_BABOV|nr:DNA repair RAD51 homolog 4, putative [Babesia ovis]